MSPRKDVDWVAIGAAWVKSEESVREIAGCHKVSHPAILKRAREEHWPARRPDARKAPVKAKLPKPVTNGGNQRAGNQGAGNQASGNSRKQVKPQQGKVLALVREWQKNWSEIGRITLEEYNGRIVVQVRAWQRNLMTGELTPTRKGLALSLDQVVEQLVPGIDDVLAKAKALGLLEEDK